MDLKSIVKELKQLLVDRKREYRILIDREKLDPVPLRERYQLLDEACEVMDGRGLSRKFPDGDLARELRRTAREQNRLYLQLIQSNELHPVQAAKKLELLQAAAIHFEDQELAAMQLDLFQTQTATESP